jgi:hypothetical protein
MRDNRRFSFVRPSVRIPWWLKLLLGYKIKPRFPSLSSFYRWRR